MQPEETKALMELVSKLRHEGLTPLNVIMQGATLLLDGKMGEISDEQRKILEMIHRSTVQATACWYAASDHIRVQFGPPLNSFKGEKVTEIVKAIQSYFKDVRQIETLSFIAAGNLPLIRANNDLTKGLIYLLDSLPIRYFLQEYPPNIQIQPVPGRVIFRFSQRLPQYKQAQLEKFYASGGTAVSTWERIFDQNSGDYRVAIMDERIEIQLSIPVMEE